MPDNVLYPSRTHGKSRLAKLREQRVDSQEKASTSGTRVHLPAKAYVLALPQAFMGLVGIVATYYLLHRVHPSEIANLGGESVYLPLLLSISWACFWSLSFITQHWRRSAIATSIVMGWTWLRLHDQTVFPGLFLFAGVLIVIELYLTNREAQA